MKAHNFKPIFQIFLITAVLSSFTFGVEPVFLDHYYPLKSDGSNTVIYIDKQIQQLSVYQSDNSGSFNLIKSFEVLTGPESGKKTRAGDNKTPEGIYYIQQKMGFKNAEPLALLLDYPNELDIQQGNTGTNIWIQSGLPDDDEINSGCIYLKNEKLADLLPYVNVKETPIIICDGKRIIREQVFDQNKLGWLQFWNDFADSQQLSDEGLKSLAIVACADEIHVLEKKEEAEDSQSYQKMTKYVFSPDDKEFIKSVLMYEGAHNFDEQIKAAVEAWRDAWEDGDTDRYISCYSAKFNSDNRNKNELYNYKKQVFSRTSNMTVKISDIQVKQEDEGLWLVLFKQDYSTGNYRDSGYKMLAFERSADSNFRILSERWFAYKPDF